MGDFRDFADRLQQEVVTDMAEAYFGDRKNLDEMIEAFHDMVEDFRKQAPGLERAAAELHHLLLDRQTARDFYISLDIVPSCIPFNGAGGFEKLESLPFAFTSLKRYQRCVYESYSRFSRVADVYLNGRYYEDPEHKGRKRLTVHYLRLKALAEYINDEVDRINKTMPPSGTLRYVKKMDIEQSERELIIGEACLINGCALDTDLEFAPVDFEALGLLVVQDLPYPKKVKAAIYDFCKEIYPLRKHDIKAAMSALRKG